MYSFAVHDSCARKQDMVWACLGIEWCPLIVWTEPSSPTVYTGMGGTEEKHGWNGSSEYEVEDLSMVMLPDQECMCQTLTLFETTLFLRWLAPHLQDGCNSLLMAEMGVLLGLPFADASLPFPLRLAPHSYRFGAQMSINFMFLKLPTWTAWRAVVFLCFWYPGPPYSTCAVEAVWKSCDKASEVNMTVTTKSACPRDVGPISLWR